MPIAPRGLTVLPIQGIPTVAAGDDLARLLADAMASADMSVTSTDVVVVAQKVVSKAEGAVVNLDDVSPGDEAQRLAGIVEKDPRLVELILASSNRVIRAVPGVLIVETLHGLVCANAGIDASNAPGRGSVVLLPDQPDLSARLLREGIGRITGVTPAIVISDTFNRPWRQGSMNVAIGTAGFVPLDDGRGALDDSGRPLKSTIVSVADEVASAAQLVMGETGGVPAAVVRGLQLKPSGEGSGSLRRDPERDLFR